jgi:hypothetical protein
MRSWYPPLAKNAKDMAPHGVGDASEIKSLGHPSPGSRHHDASRQAGIDESVVTAARLLPLGPPSENRAHLDRRPTGDQGLTPPRQRLVQVSGFQYQKPPMCSLVSRYGPSVTSTLPLGCARSDLALLAADEAASENPDTGSLHLLVERVDLGGDRPLRTGRSRRGGE